MKKDIDFPKVEQVGICAVPKASSGITYWNVHVLNMLDHPIENVLVSTKGYGRQDEEKVKTSELRHYFETIPANEARAVEVIPSELIGLSNQYWISFYLNKRLFDKKFIFLPDTLLEKNLTHVPILNEQGILII